MRGLEAQWRSRLEEQQAATQQQLAEVSHQHAQELGALREELSTAQLHLNETILDNSRVLDRVAAEQEQRVQDSLSAFTEWKRRELQQLESQYERYAVLLMFSSRPSRLLLLFLLLLSLSVGRLGTEVTSLLKRVEALTSEKDVLQASINKLTSELAESQKQTRLSNKELQKVRKAHADDVVRSAEDVQAVVAKLSAEMNASRFEAEAEHRKQIVAVEARLASEHRQALACVLASGVPSCFLPLCQLC